MSPIQYDWCLLRRGNLDTDRGVKDMRARVRAHTHTGPHEDTGRWLSVNQGERPQKKPPANTLVSDFKTPEL